MLDGPFSHLFVVKKLCLFEKMKINEKEAGEGPLFKKDVTTVIFRPIDGIMGYFEKLRF